MPQPAEPAFLLDHTKPYPLGYARDRMLEAVRAFPAARDADVRDALVGFTARVAGDCARRADELGLLLQAEVFRRFAGALLREQTDEPISVNRAGVYHAVLEQAYSDEALARIEPLLGMLDVTD
jgi:hypothetical protein